MFKHFISITLVGGYLLAYIPLSMAALGGAPMTTPPDASVSSKIETNSAPEKSFNASSVSSYSVVETRLSTGDISREYVSIDNRVFAVAWEGRHMPDMAALLGEYFDRYRTTLANQRTSRDSHIPVGVVQNDLIVYIGGRTGNSYVRAWLPDALPTGVQPGAIR
ncbi:DUF2844 domain-containing protein [Burkholderia ubonensis]|uniref:DUF2844 domain-containing protein n=2 Tax=Burkholderia ubonensis TaxID=101571 RepID=UPI0008FD9E31|nr:DUF2844 domain-containing protein [Burkholderia ubonensis]